MTFEEANRAYLKWNSDLYKYDDLGDLAMEAFTKGQPRKICYSCTRKDRCLWSEYDRGLGGCNFYIKKSSS